MKQEGEQRVNCIPFYALVPGDDPEARFPKARSERFEMSVKESPRSTGGHQHLKLVNASPTMTNRDPSRVSWAGGSVAGARESNRVSWAGGSVAGASVPGMQRV